MFKTGSGIAKMMSSHLGSGASATRAQRPTPAFGKAAAASVAKPISGLSLGRS